jgi:fused signal recognition particle receptor
MFNWFRRQLGTPNPPAETPPEPSEQQETSLELVEPSEESSSEAYLAWAKEAYKNIRERKTPDSPLESPTPETASESVESAVVAPETTGPAWLQKSAGLEALKETALESTPVDAPLMAKADEPNWQEDFLWSAQVLAAQGRSPQEVSEDEINWLNKLRQGLSKTRRNLVNQLKAVVGQGPLNQEAVEAIESLLLQADVGVEATEYIIEALQAKLRQEALPPEQAIDFLKGILRQILDRPLTNSSQMEFVPADGCLNIWLLTGVNGVGKTTTIGKLAHLAKNSGYECLIAAADTFRAAAVEQVKVWGERTGVSVIANPGANTDPAAVVFDGISAAQSRNVNVLLIDTAGRLQNKKNLMDELGKIRRIIDKKAPTARVESLLVLDATLGQNGLRQAQVFAEVAQVSGVVLTKLDGTAKGGVALAIAQQLNLPIRFIGAGEGIEDLRPFASYEFVEALLNG